MNVINPSIIFVIKCFPCTYVAFLLGRFVKKLGKEAYTSWMCVLAFVTLVVLSFFFNIEVSDGKIGNVTYFVVASVCGWIMMKGLAGFLLRIGIGIELLKYIGQHTMSILCLHVLCFKIISYIYMCVYGKPKVLLAAFHVIFDANELWKLAYMFDGIIVPLLAYRIYEIMRCHRLHNLKLPGE